MRYILKTLNEDTTQITDIERLNDGCKYYITMKSYLEAMPEAQMKNPEFYNRLVTECYRVEESEVDEPLTTERTQADAQFVSLTIEAYYGAMLNIMRAREQGNPPRM